MTEFSFERSAIRAFRFVRCDFDAQSGVARLVYAFDNGPELVETVTVHGAPFVLDGLRAQAAEKALQLLHLITGVSYYKAAVPEEIRIESYGIDAETAGLLEDIYVNGLGEFAYRNGLNLHGRIRFPVADSPSPPPSPASGRGSESTSGRGSESAPLLPPRAGGGRDGAAPPIGLRQHALVAIGGGKDSLVSIEALRAIGIDQTVSWVGGSQLIKACAERTGLPTLNIGRQLAPELFEYNRQGAWNGHIPVTAINSAILVFAAVLLGVDQMVFSNERSASYGSLIEGTGEVNHQWSKSWAFERAFGDYVRREIAADLQYYSLLRPLSELAVARQFAKSDRYDAHFSSCNRNFHLLGERPAQRWCGVCPKCHFVFLALAPFMPKPRLLNIFGRNLLDEPEQAPGFDALLEYGNHKPFECVGEGRESRAAMAALTQRPEWREDALVERFAREIRPLLAVEDLSVESLLVLDEEQRIPPQLWDRLRAHLAA
ncbi:MAG: endonuclease domain-containing protein [Luteimonas sp.]|nr:endonuclease domain-containing protein [Luteimonas sp.]